MGRTSFQGPVYGALYPLVIPVGKVTTSDTNARYGYVPEGYRFIPRKVTIGLSGETAIHGAVVNLGPTADSDAWVDARALTSDSISSVLGGEITMNGSGDGYADGATNIVLTITTTTSHSASNVFVTVWGYMHSSEALMSTVGED